MTQKTLSALVIAGLAVSCVALAQGSAGGDTNTYSNPGTADDTPTDSRDDTTSGAITRSDSSEAALDKETIRQAQQALGVSADGVSGPQTERSVRQFQADHGLTQTGMLDQDTLKALNIGSSTPSRATSSP